MRLKGKARLLKSSEKQTKKKKDVFTSMLSLKIRDFIWRIGQDGKEKVYKVRDIKQNKVVLFNMKYGIEFKTTLEDIERSGYKVKEQEQKINKEVEEIKKLIEKMEDGRLKTVLNETLNNLNL